MFSFAKSIQTTSKVAVPFHIPSSKIEFLYLHILISKYFCVLNFSHSDRCVACISLLLTSFFLKVRSSGSTFVMNSIPIRALISGVDVELWQLWFSEICMHTATIYVLNEYFVSYNTVHQLSLINKHKLSSAVCCAWLLCRVQLFGTP